MLQALCCYFTQMFTIEGSGVQLVQKPVSYFDAIMTCFLGSLQRSSVQRRHQEWCLAAGGLG